MTDAQVIRWWELRRIVYNALILAIGIAALWAMERFLDAALGAGRAGADTVGLSLLSAGYALGANIFYTLGRLIEFEERKNSPESARLRAVSNFHKGLLFSCGLTTLPFWFGLAFRLLHR